MVSKIKRFRKITVELLKIKANTAHFRYIIESSNDIKKQYELIISMPYKIDNNTAELLKLASIIPALNYAIFTQNIELKYKIDEYSLAFIKYLKRIATIEVLFNKLMNIENKLLKVKFRNLNYKEILKNSAEITANTKEESLFNGSNGYDKDSVMLLVGGGKDSLTAYGLLNEAGFRVYPLYVNEAGRHWLTAKKSYDYLSNVDDKTIRVWTNIDRLYAFINGQLGILRENFIKIKSDYYPIQDLLYPFHVLIAASLCVHFKCGNIAMGNEYNYPDTFLKIIDNILTFGGIYDQSFIFEEDMTEFFSPINISVWSPIRPISGFLVQKILVKRYPNLFRYQMSCHSPRRNAQGEIVHCGTCKKCRRILLMTMAIGADYGLLGFNESHVSYLKRKISSGKWDFDDQRSIRHCLYLLRSRDGFSNLNVEDYPFAEYIHIDDVNAPRDFAPENVVEKILPLIRRDAKGYIKVNSTMYLNYIKSFKDTFH